MRLWTIQPVKVVNILERDGVFTCDPEKSEYYNAFYDAYLWIAAEMDKRNIPHPDGIKLPLWAWHTSDYNSWHYVLNHCWFDDSQTENEWNALCDWFNSLKPEEKAKLTIESWQKIFDVTKQKNDWFTNGRYIQATFWELRKDMVTNIKYFKAK